MRDGKIVVGLYEASTSAAIRALAEGFLFHGYDIEIRNAYHFKRNEAEKYFDIVVVFGLRYKFREVYDYYKELGKRILVFDFGYLDRVSVRDDYHTRHWYLGLDGFGWKPDVDCPKDRYKSLQAKVDYGKRKKTNRIVICGQMPDDASHRMGVAELKRFYDGIYSYLKGRYGNKYAIEFRQHPLAKDFKPDQVRVSEEETLDDCLNSAHAVIVYNSTVGIDALLRGCPVIAYGPSVYSELVNDPNCDIDGISAPSEEEVERFCTKLAYAQWTLKECSEGLPVKFLSDNGYIRAAV